MIGTLPWTKANAWPLDREDEWVWQWNKYESWEPKLVYVPPGFDRTSKKSVWGKWFASKDFDHRRVNPSLNCIKDADEIRFANIFGDAFFIMHLSSCGILRYRPVVELFLDRPVSVPDNVAIVTFATDDIASQALLIRQLDKNGIAYDNLAHHALPRGQGWKHYFKFPGLVEFVPTLKQEYVLVLDGIDVLLCQPLESIIDRFNAYGKDVVFGAQKNPWPKDVTVPGEEPTDGYGRYRYLNSGTVLGRRDAVASFFERAWTVQREQTRRENDQWPCRVVFCERRDTVEIDHRCSLFQNVNMMKFNGQMLTVG